MKKRMMILVLMGCIFGCGLVTVNVRAEERTDFSEVSKNCDSVKEILKNVQREDSRIRVYLGSYYERIITKYVTRLNLRLVENNLSQTGLIDGQGKMADKRAEFVQNFIDYQKELEELVAMDCKAEPEKFYKELEVVREGRAKVLADTTKMKKLITEHRDGVKELRQKIGGKDDEQKTVNEQGFENVEGQEGAE